MTAPAAAPPWRMGNGNSPPARKLACLPSIASTLGSASISSRFLLWSRRIVAPRFRSGRNRKMFSASDSVNVVTPLLCCRVGAENCPVVTAADRASEASGAEQVGAEIVRGGPVHVGEADLEQHLGVHRADLDLQEVDDLSQCAGNGCRPIGADEVLHGASQEDAVVLHGNGNVLPRQLLGQFAAHGLDRGRAGAHVEIEDEAVAALLPDDQAGFPGRDPVDQNFARRYRDRLGQRRVGHRHALDHHGTIHDQRLAGRDEQISGRGRGRLLGVRQIAAEEVRGLVPAFPSRPSLSFLRNCRLELFHP